MVDDRKQYLDQVIKYVCGEYTEWTEGPQDQISEQLETAVDDLLHMFSFGDMPSRYRELARRVEAIGPVWNDWKERVDRYGRRERVGNEVFELIEHLPMLQIDANRRPRSLEPIAELVKQGVSQTLICNIYGFWDDRGAADFQMLREEIAEPGKHTSPPWMPPDERKRNANEAKQAEILAAISAKREAKLAKKAAALEPMTNNPRLAQDGVSAQQIARMCGCTEAQVFTACDEAGVARPPERYTLPAKSDKEKPLPEAVIEAMDAYVEKARWVRANRPEQPEDEDYDDVPFDEEPLTLEQQIVALYEQGASTEDICETLTTDQQKCSPQKVRAVVKKYETDPSGFTVS